MSRIRPPHRCPPPHRNIATIAVFYALPVVQLVITYQTVRGWAGSPGPVQSTLAKCPSLGLWRAHRS